MSQRQRDFFESTERGTLVICPGCSTSEDFFGVITPSEMQEDGYAIVDGAWTGLCESCETQRADASNAECEALVRAAKELGRCHHKAGPLNMVEIPVDEGFELEGEKHYGFWAISGDYSDGGFERFRHAADTIVANLNSNRSTELRVNVNGAGTQAIVHGIVD